MSSFYKGTRTRAQKNGRPLQGKVPSKIFITPQKPEFYDDDDASSM